jgi:H+/gluconate symporter-like permease
VVSFFPLFLLGALFGKVMDASGAAQILARAIATAVGPANAILAVVLACAVLTYGGVSLFVVAFVAWPLARALFAETGLPARLIPATIALGAFTFTMTALPGTPSIQNAIPMATFRHHALCGTRPWGDRGGRNAGAGHGLAALSRPGAGGRSTACGAPGVAPRRAPAPLGGARADPVGRGGDAGHGLGGAACDWRRATLPAAYGETDLGRVGGLWSVITALTVALVLALVLSRPPQLMKTLNDGAESALLPLFNTASLVGFGAVIASLPGFEVLRQGLDGLSGGNVVVTAALSSGRLRASPDRHRAACRLRWTCWGLR